MNPGPEHIIPEGITGTVIVEICYQHQKQHVECLQHDQVDNVLKYILVTSLNEGCIRGPHHKHAEHANVTTLEIFTYLCDIHARINSNDPKKMMNV